MCTGYEIKFYNWKAILPNWSAADYPSLVYASLVEANRAAEKLLNDFSGRIEANGIQRKSWVNGLCTSRHPYISDAEYEFIDSGHVPNSKYFDGEAVVEERVYRSGVYSHHNYIRAYVWVEDTESSPYEF